MALPLQRDARWLFIGDSITDCGRRFCADGLGQGYVRIIRDWLLARDWKNAPEVLNRGIGGDKVTSLEARWSEDVIALEPDLLSIKIGINDVWHGLRGRNEGVPVDVFGEVYTRLLDQVTEAFPKTKIVLCEPSVIVEPGPVEGNELLLPYKDVIRSLAEERRLAVVPLFQVFTDAVAQRPDVEWLPDGVHPSSAGHMLLARTWLAAAGLL